MMATDERFGTLDDILVRDWDVLWKEVEALVRLFPSTFQGIYTNRANPPLEDGKILFRVYESAANNRKQLWVGGTGVGLLQELKSIPGSWPPSEWTDDAKKAHADVYNYPEWLPQFIRFQRNQFELLSFLQRHIRPDSLAVLQGQSYEGLRELQAWTCAFNETQVVYYTSQDLRRVAVSKLLGEERKLERAEYELITSG